MANTVYNNAVIAAQAKDILTTAVNARSLMTIDTDLQENAGMKKTINTYVYSGTAEELAAGVGNTAANRGSISYTGKDYTVKLVQQAYDYTDEDVMKDPQIVDMLTQGASQVMANKLTADFYTAVAAASTGASATIGTTTFANGSTIGYDAVVDAIADMNIEDESGLFLLVSPEWKGDIRKDDDYKAAQMGEVVYNGQVGTIAGIPVIATKALTPAAGASAYALLMTKDAVKCFVKKDVEVEQDRNADTRTNSVYLRTAYVVAVVDGTKARKIVEAAQ